MRCQMVIQGSKYKRLKMIFLFLGQNIFCEYGTQKNSYNEMIVLLTQNSKFNMKHAERGTIDMKHISNNV